MFGISPAGRFLSLLRMVLDTKPSDSWLLQSVTCPVRLKGKKQLGREGLIL